ncbi:MAG: hypothetical protein KGN33_18030 [Paracoccaceae bacterium]|nr:hypothetical protein [Paracoccaceae bacterium]
MTDEEVIRAFKALAPEPQAKLLELLQAIVTEWEAATAGADDEADLTDYRFADGSRIPADAFENDSGTPDPERTAKRSGAKFRAQLDEMLARQVAIARGMAADDGNDLPTAADAQPRLTDAARGLTGNATQAAIDALQAALADLARAHGLDPAALHVLASDSRGTVAAFNGDLRLSIFTPGSLAQATRWAAG